MKKKIILSKLNQVLMKLKIDLFIILYFNSLVSKVSLTRTVNGYQITSSIFTPKNLPKLFYQGKANSPNISIINRNSYICHGIPKLIEY